MKCTLCTKFIDQISCVWCEGESKQLQHSAALEHAETMSQKKAFDCPSKGPSNRHMGANRKEAVTDE